MLLALHFKVLPWGKTVLRLSSAVKWDCQSDKRLVKFWPLRLSRLLLRWLGWAEWLQVLQAMATLKASYHEHWSKAEHPEASCWKFMRFSAADWISTWNNNNPHNGLASFWLTFVSKAGQHYKSIVAAPSPGRVAPAIWFGIGFRVLETKPFGCSSLLPWKLWF